MQNSIYKIKYLLFLSWDWEAWCLTVWGVIPAPPERNTAWNKGRKCFHCLGAPNNLIRPWSADRTDHSETRGCHRSITAIVLSDDFSTWMYLCGHDGLIPHPGSPTKVLDTRFWRPLRQSRGNMQLQRLCEMLPDFETRKSSKPSGKKLFISFRLGTKTKCDNYRMAIMWNSSFLTN